MNLKLICEVISIYKKANYKAYLVGGSSRDFIFGNNFTDIDIATNAPLTFTCKSFIVVDDKGKNMGSVKINFHNIVMEITRFREDVYDNKSIYPSSVTFIDDEEKDALRRDFTINAIYLDPTNNNVIDPFNGMKDLFSFTLKFIGDPKTRILEDPTRILRGIRLACRLNINIDPDTDKAFLENINELDRISTSKYNKEIERLFTELGEFKATKLLNKYNLARRKENDNQ